MAKKKLKFELAPQDKIEKYQKEVTVIVKALGHPEALVTDESRISDFMSVFDSRGTDISKRGGKLLIKLAKKLKLKAIRHTDNICDIAEQIHKMSKKE